MEKDLFIDASHPTETRFVLKTKDHIEEYEYESKNKLNLKNNIYLGKVSRVEPSLQAAFVNYGRQRQGFLALNDIQSDYYQIPHDDKEKLKEEEEKIRQQLKEESKIKEENQNYLDNPTNNSTSAQEDIDLVKDKSSSTQNNNNDGNFHGRKNGTRRYKIQEVIKPGQIILVQILKEERGQKGAALTTFISLAGKYTVLMPNTPKGGGISRKIFNSEDRKKIRNILKEILIPESMGLIVRTAGMNKTKNDINNDLKNTLNVWEEVRNKAVNSIAPTLVYEEGDIIKRAIRDTYDSHTKSVFVEGNEGYQKAKNYMKLLMPGNVKYVKKYRGKIPLFQKEGIEAKLNSIFETNIKLNSGGYIVINPTEALVSIDINSGKSTKEVNIERTALATNLEAADEIARQIKIRDLAGLIIIDFIDMMNFYNRRLVERKLRERLKDDRARIQFGRISTFGLLEMSRQRLREGSVKWNMVLDLNSFSLKILKLAEELSISSKSKNIKIFVSQKVRSNIENNYKDELNYLKNKLKLVITIICENNFIIPEYKIELYNKNKKMVNKKEYVEKIEKFSKRNLEKENKKALPLAKNKRKPSYKKRYRYFQRNKKPYKRFPNTL